MVSIMEPLSTGAINTLLQGLAGRPEFLATSLLDSDAFPASKFADLYHRRWRIEECFKLLKCRLGVKGIFTRQ